MKILIIAPLPPPVTGNSLAVKVLLDQSSDKIDPEVVNLSKNSFVNGVNSFGRIRQIMSIFREVSRKKHGVELVYFTISESIAGNLKDLVIYLLCYRQLPKMIIHLHGGAGMRQIMNRKNSLLCRLNRFFIRKMKGVIVLGERHLGIYDDFVAGKKLHIVKNFAEDFLFLSEEELVSKFADLGGINVLFLSNLIEGKGHLELLAAFRQLPDAYKQHISMTFAGGFESEAQKALFLAEIANEPGIRYAGTVSGIEKRKLFVQAHVFALPTYYPYEGQPISILEAFASGCFVITTDHSGIFDIFKDGENGRAVEKKSSTSLSEVLRDVVDRRGDLVEIGRHNYRIANEQYRIHHHIQNMNRVLYQD